MTKMVNFGWDFHYESSISYLSSCFQLAGAVFFLKVRIKKRLVYTFYQIPFFNNDFDRWLHKKSNTSAGYPWILIHIRLNAPLN